jgi:hypothetical protein
MLVKCCHLSSFIQRIIFKFSSHNKKYRQRYIFSMFLFTRFSVYMIYMSMKQPISMVNVNLQICTSTSLLVTSAAPGFKALTLS